MSIASSSAVTNAIVSSKSSFRRGGSSAGSMKGQSQPPSRPPRKKRSVSSSLSGESDTIRNINSIGRNSNNPNDIDTSTEERDKKKNSKPKKPPPIPANPPNLSESYYGKTVKLNEYNNLLLGRRQELYNPAMAFSKDGARMSRPIGSTKMKSAKSMNNASQDSGYTNTDSGDILTKVAIPRSGSFLNTAGLTRYKSRATRRNITGKQGSGSGGFTGGGGGSPLGFSELFNEFRLQENLHSLDEILNAIIDSDGMSFNDLKPIYKEFLLKLAVTLTKDELYQRSKSIMRRQKKKKLKRKNSSLQGQRTKFSIGAMGMKMFRLGKYKSKKTPNPISTSKSKQSEIMPSSEYELKARSKKLDRSRIGTSGSEVSVHRNEHAMNAHNRNSSSG